MPHPDTGPGVYPKPYYSIAIHLPLIIAERGEMSRRMLGGMGPGDMGLTAGM
jgi:hypothetical protein